MEVDTLIKRLRKVDDLVKLLLSKEQRHFLPYLKSSMLSVNIKTSKVGDDGEMINSILYKEAKYFKRKVTGRLLKEMIDWGEHFERQRNMKGEIELLDEV